MLFGLEKHPKVRALLNIAPCYIKTRWSYLAFIVFIFWLRIIQNASHYVIVYMHSVFFLSLLIQFLTPLNFEELCERYAASKNGNILPVTVDDASDKQGNNDVPLHSSSSSEDKEEFRPFLRKLNEFHFWLYGTHATHLAIFTTFFDIFDLPVFWPLLVMYFIALFISTMKTQISNMIKYKYIPFTLSKQRYNANSRF